MDPVYAYAHGALVKMAERNVDPAQFIQVAISTQDPGAVKIARAILEYEKVANRTEAMKDVAQQGVNMASDALARGRQSVGGGIDAVTGAAASIPGMPAPIANVFAGTPGATEDAAKYLGQEAAQGARTVVDRAPDVARDVAGRASEAGAVLSDAAGALLGGAGRAANATADSILTAPQRGVDSVADSILGLPGAVADTARSAKARVGQFGENVDSGMGGRQEAQDRLNVLADRFGGIRNVPSAYSDPLRQRVSDQNKALFGTLVGVPGAALGADYLSDPADTTGNQILGALRLQQQSRLGNIMEPVGDRLESLTGKTIFNR